LESQDKKERSQENHKENHKKKIKKRRIKRIKNNKESGSLLRLWRSLCNPALFPV
jgi:hypothetical protein